MSDCSTLEDVGQLAGVFLIDFPPSQLIGVVTQTAEDAPQLKISFKNLKYIQ